METDFILLSSPVREIPNVSSVLEFSNLVLLGVLSLYCRLIGYFIMSSIFSVSAGFLFCVLLVITACTVAQVRLVAVLRKGHRADKGSKL